MKSKAAWRVADQGPGEEPLDLETAEHVEATLVRSEGLVNALAVLEDLPDEAYGRADRWQIAAVVVASDEHAAELPEAERTRLALRVAERERREGV